MATATAVESTDLSVECALGRQPGYDDVHDLCRQTEDVPLPHSAGILVIRRCRCVCHRYGRTRS